jgi:hypothetical protein
MGSVDWSTDLGHSHLANDPKVDFDDDGESAANDIWTVGDQVILHLSEN